VVQQVELRRLVQIATHADALPEAAPPANVHGGDLPDRAVRAEVLRLQECSFEPDPVLAVRLSADIALRALSPEGRRPGHRSRRDRGDVLARSALGAGSDSRAGRWHGRMRRPRGRLIPAEEAIGGR